MQSKRATSLLGAVAVAVAVLGGAPAAQATRSGEAVIVQLREDASLRAATAGLTVTERYTEVFKGYSAVLSAAAIAGLRADRDVLRVVADDEIHALDTQHGAPWGLDRTDQRDLPLSGDYTYDDTGAGVTVFVVDTGVRASHSEFGGRAVGGHDFVDSDSNPDDCHGHGTHVAGTVGGGTYGVAKGVTIVPVRVLDCAASGVVGTALAAFDWVIANKPAGPAVLNFSVGGSGTNPLLDAGAQSVLDAGISFVAAAGNDANDACSASPGHVPGVLTVGASDIDDNAPIWSAYGDCIDLFAPGENIVSAGIASDAAAVPSSGTSMSSPHVAGAAARYLQAAPNAGVADVAGFLNGTATPNKVALALSPNNRLLHVDGAAVTPIPVTPPVVVTPPPPPVVVTPPPVVVTPPAPNVVVAPPIPAGTWSGRGDKVVRMKATETGRVSIKYTGQGGNFAVWALNRKGRKSQLLVNEIGAYTGVVSYQADPSKRGRISGFSIKADGPWAATPRTMASAPRLTKVESGRGDFVLRVKAGMKRLRAKHTGRGNFAIFTLDAAGQYNDLPINEIGRYRGTVATAKGVRYLVITADGAWRVTRKR